MIVWVSLRPEGPSLHRASPRTPLKQHPEVGWKIAGQLMNGEIAVKNAKIVNSRSTIAIISR